MVRKKISRIYVYPEFKQFVKVESAKREKTIMEFCDDLKDLVKKADTPKKTSLWGRI